MNQVAYEAQVEVVGEIETEIADLRAMRDRFQVREIGAIAKAIIIAQINSDIEDLSRAIGRG